MKARTMSHFKKKHTVVESDPPPPYSDYGSEGKVDLEKGLKVFQFFVDKISHKCASKYGLLSLL
jgi:hypothetical protein